MTTLTERLRELEALDIGRLDDGGRAISSARVAANLSLHLAQELHALLVECGEALDWMTENVGRANPWTQEARQVLTKLKQAGIV
jgi:hypothetical protein